jgi:thymidylate synthase
LRDFFKQQHRNRLRVKLIEFKTKQEWVVLKPEMTKKRAASKSGKEVVKRRLSSGPSRNEEGYLTLVRELIDRGWSVPDRTGVGTKFLPGCTLKFDLSDYQLPLLTTRKIVWKNIVTELLFFLQGQTDTTLLSDQGVHIWEPNTRRSFLDSRGLGNNKGSDDPDLILKEGDMGPGYGFQWRHFGAGRYYINGSRSYEGLGVDQIKNVFQSLKSDPFGRRHLVTAYCPTDTHLMALPPCHFAFQFLVQPASDDRMCLHIVVSQRSADIILGVPSNVASYALLLFIFCHYLDMDPGTLTHNMAHAHIYNNHVDIAEKQLARTPKTPPFLSLINMPDDFEELTPDNFRVVGYAPDSFLKFPFAV